jgi:hypothetical protein
MAENPASLPRPTPASVQDVSSLSQMLDTMRNEVRVAVRSRLDEDHEYCIAIDARRRVFTRRDSESPKD